MKLLAMSFFLPAFVSCMASPEALADPLSPVERRAVEPDGYRWAPVSGVATHYFTTAIVHSAEPTDTGFIQRSTDIVELEGDLVGRVLYHPTSVFDFVEGTLVNSGSQVFSGTVLGSQPVLLHDDEFRVEVDLVDGTTEGQMFLVDHLAGPKVRCRLQITGNGEQTPEGDAIVDYVGECRIRTPRPSTGPTR